MLLCGGKTPCLAKSTTEREDDSGKACLSGVRMHVGTPKSPCGHWEPVVIWITSELQAELEIQSYPNPILCTGIAEGGGQRLSLMPLLQSESWEYGSPICFPTS